MFKVKNEVIIMRYAKAEMELVEFDVEDIITASGDLDDSDIIDEDL